MRIDCIFFFLVQSRKIIFKTKLVWLFLQETYDFETNERLNNTVQILTLAFRVC